MVFPCVIKPATGSGGSSAVLLCHGKEEALVYSEYLLQNSNSAVAQEYISLDEGEFTVGVLSRPDGRTVGSIALKRLFHSKLSVLSKTHTGLISSGYSQGVVGDFPEVTDTAEKIAEALRSAGPLNIQGRVKDGEFMPFEINPRFSASTYLRAMAGFNEVDIFLQFMADRTPEIPSNIRYGYYLRSLSEVFVSKKDVWK
jgi:carbamoyl-phosphate synthase large subunit